VKALVQPRLPRKVGGTCLPPEIVCKDYVLINKDKIEKLIFTSGENYNNALANFKRIIGDEFDFQQSSFKFTFSIRRFKYIEFQFRQHYFRIKKRPV
jgi:hypothetical protein